jgi:hypothetical protein
MLDGDGVVLEELLSELGGCRHESWIAGGGRINEVAAKKLTRFVRGPRNPQHSRP